MLSIYRRHKPKCKYAADRASRKCRCAVWCDGTVEGERVRQSLKTRSWERADQLKRNIENRNPSAVQTKTITIKDALDAFVKDCESRNLHKSTLGKYRRLRDSIGTFAKRKNLDNLGKFANRDLVGEYRNSWTVAPRTASKELERLRAFFKFCVENDWITKNPAKAIKAPQVKTAPRIPFSEQEVQDIIAQSADDKELAFLLVLRHTGLRIGDASLLKVSQFDGERIHLYTTKAGVRVSIKVPPQLASLLQKIPPHGGYFFLRGDSIHVHSVSNCWRKVIKRMCKKAKITPDHPHRFRHSLAADLLMKGAGVEDVAAILGNSPAIVIKHYSQWIKGRNDRLDAFLEKTWEAPKLALVKK